MRQRVALAIALSMLVLHLVPIHGRAQTPPWVEPRALSVVDMAGQVPDAALAGHIVTYGYPGGLATYESASWSGGKLRIQLRVYPRFRWAPAEGGWICDGPLLGHAPVLDRMSASAPAASLRVYDGGVDVTDQVMYYNYTDPALTQPTSGSAYPRYANAGQVLGVTRPIPADGIPIPAHWTGSFSLKTQARVLTVIWTLTPSTRPTVRYLGEESFQYPSYIGPGHTGWFEKLMKQMRNRFDDRHPRYALSIPPAANYVLLVYEPMPFDADAGYWADDEGLFEQNKLQPIAGTVRFSSDGAKLTQDLNHGGAFPVDAWWQDADQSAGPYLSPFTSAAEPLTQMTPPEFVLLPGAPYRSCYKNGGCSNAVLDEIHAARAAIKLAYLQVDPLYAGTTPIPLRMADTNWHPGLAMDTSSLVTPSLSTAMTLYPVRAVLPLIVSTRPEVPDLPGDRPLGLFDAASGRMVGYLPY